MIGVGESGTQALRLDSIEAQGSESLEQALASGWIDGVETNSIETLKDVDLPTFSCLLFVLVALGVAAGLALFYLLLHLFGLSVG